MIKLLLHRSQETRKTNIFAHVRNLNKSWGFVVEEAQNRVSVRGISARNCATVKITRTF